MWTWSGGVARAVRSLRAKGLMPLPIFASPGFRRVLMSSLALAALAALAALVAPATAFADESAAKSEPAPTRRTVVMTVSPLAPIAGRWGGGIEWLVVPHHAVTASFSYVSVTPGCCSAATGQSGGGGGGGGSPENLIRGTSVELGYRYYDHPELPKGLWFAPSLVFFHGAGSVDGTPTGELTQVGIAVDGGVQALLWDRVALGAGVGFEAVYSFTKTRPTLEDAPLAMLAFGDRYLLSRVGPRLLVNVGAAF